MPMTKTEARKLRDTIRSETGYKACIGGSRTYPCFVVVELPGGRVKDIWSVEGWEHHKAMEQPNLFAGMGESA